MLCLLRILEGLFQDLDIFFSGLALDLRLFEQDVCPNEGESVF